MSIIIRAAVLAAAVISQSALAGASGLKVYSANGVQAPLEELTPKFEKTTGHKLTFAWGTALGLVKRIQAGETVDVVVLTRAAVDILSKEGKIASGSETTLASSSIAIAVKAGAPKPDISTTEALKRSLLNARSISYADPATGAASGIFFARVLERLGIANEMKAKTKYPPPNGYSAALLLTGEAELAIQQKPELTHISGTEVVGLLPADVNMLTVFVAAVGADRKDSDAANALVRFLHSPEAAAVFTAKGLNPP
jgi:molybdate transport system substrate-binding protein